MATVDLLMRRPQVWMIIHAAICKTKDYDGTMPHSICSSPSGCHRSLPGRAAAGEVARWAHVRRGWLQALLTQQHVLLHKPPDHQHLEPPQVGHLQSKAAFLFWLRDYFSAFAIQLYRSAAGHKQHLKAKAANAAKHARWDRC